jgi:hypothetical protein
MPARMPYGNNFIGMQGYLTANQGKPSTYDTTLTGGRDRDSAGNIIAGGQYTSGMSMLDSALYGYYYGTGANGPPPNDDGGTGPGGHQNGGGTGIGAAGGGAPWTNETGTGPGAESDWWDTHGSGLEGSPKGKQHFQRMLGSMAL